MSVAAQRGHSEVVTLLCDRGANIEVNADVKKRLITDSFSVAHVSTYIVCSIEPTDDP